MDFAGILSAIAPAAITAIGSGLTGQAQEESRREGGREVAMIEQQTALQVQQLRDEISREQMKVEQAKAALEAATQRLQTLQGAYNTAVNQSSQAAQTSQDAAKTLIAAIQGPFARGTQQIQGAYK